MEGWQAEWATAQSMVPLSRKGENFRANMSSFWPRLLRWRLPAAGLVVVAAFAVLTGRFWHPHYGFTKFVQLDEADHRGGISEVRTHPVFAYQGFNGYDGAAYLQLAYHPLLDSAELKPALDNFSYRARRILGSALAWMLSGGQPERIAGTYAALNLGVWLLFAALLWRVLPVTDARSWAAWVGVVLSAGALHSVRLALTDLIAATLATAAIGLAERGRSRGALGVLALAGLARETVLATVVALWRGPWFSARPWLRNTGRTVLVAVPLLGWMLYVRQKAGPADQGLGNFFWPVIGWVEKWTETALEYSRHPEFAWLITTTLLATLALTVQAVYILRRPRWDDPWWRAGAVSVVMMALLGKAVWEGHPGAATRVLLPLGVGFAVLAVRARARWGWIVAGGLTVCSGLLALWQVPHDPREIAAGHFAGGSYVGRVETGWFGVERQSATVWAWTARAGSLAIETAPAGSVPTRLRLKLRAITPREVEVREGGTVIWRGLVDQVARWVEVPLSAPPAPGQRQLEFRSAADPVREGPQPGARALGFAVYGMELR